MGRSRSPLMSGASSRFVSPTDRPIAKRSLITLFAISSFSNWRRTASLASLYFLSLHRSWRSLEHFPSYCKAPGQSLNQAWALLEVICFSASVMA